MFNNGWAFHVKLNYDQQNHRMISWPMRCWLNLNMNDEGIHWYYDDDLNNMFFKNEEDKVRFILQWM